MRTFTSQNGTEFDIEVLDMLNTSKETSLLIEATIEEGTKLFWLNFPNYGAKPTKDQGEQIIYQSDLLEVEKWIIEKTCSRWIKADQYNTSSLKANRSYDVLLPEGHIEENLKNINVCFMFNEYQATHFRYHVND